MEQLPYLYKRNSTTRYTFISTGRRQIKKVVDFTPLSKENIFNMGFGDLQSDGTIDDKANSNNGDIIKVLSTVIHILKDFTSQFPDIQVFFSGSTIERTRLYGRILKTYYASFRKEFVITGIILLKNTYTQIPFDPKAKQEYLGFLIRRIV